MADEERQRQDSQEGESAKQVLRRVWSSVYVVSCVIVGTQEYPESTDGDVN